jgi:hypothetical protein
LWSRIDVVYILAAWNNCTPPFHRWFFVDFPTTETLMVHCTWVKILHVIVHITKCGLL